MRIWKVARFSEKVTKLATLVSIRKLYGNVQKYGRNERRARTEGSVVNVEHKWALTKKPGFDYNVTCVTRARTKVQIITTQWVKHKVL